MPEETNQNIQPDVPEKKPSIWSWFVVFIVIIIVVGLYCLVWNKSQVNVDNENKNAESDTFDKKDDKGADPNMYNWSKMDRGPYHDKVSFATSSDLVNWTDSEEILVEHASVPDVIIKDGVLYVYFVDVETDGRKEQIGLITSRDNGKTWSERQIVNIEGIGDKTAVDPAPYLLDDGRIRLYYFDISTTMRDPDLSENTMYSAISDDGINFVEESGVRFKHQAIFDPDVIKTDSGWYMYVGTDDQKVLYATSKDGLDFEYGGEVMSGGAIPNVIFESGKYYLYTGGIDIATSNSPTSFTKTSKRFDSGGLTADPGIVKLDDGSYLMVYKTSDKMPK
ncbi:MAG: Glycosyl hydrolases family 43 [bacterium ADurb.Bin212]|nr:MAG: Glycosyl hydrolases family 43 [bacterium ADurb.Bin212]